MRSLISLIRAEWRLLLFGFLMTFSSSFGHTYFIGLFGGEIRDALSLSHGDFGLVYSAATLLSALVLLWSGSLVDYLDLRRYAYLAAGGLCRRLPVAGFKPKHDGLICQLANTAPDGSGPDVFGWLNHYGAVLTSSQRQSQCHCRNGLFSSRGSTPAIGGCTTSHAELA